MTLHVCEYACTVQTSMDYLCVFVCRHVLCLSVYNTFHAYYSLSGYELYSFCLMCCMAAKWDYGREQQSMRCLSCPCQDRIVQHNRWVQHNAVVPLRSEYVSYGVCWGHVNLQLHTIVRPLIVSSRYCQYIMIFTLLSCDFLIIIVFIIIPSFPNQNHQTKANNVFGSWLMCSGLWENFVPMMAEFLGLILGASGPKQYMLNTTAKCKTLHKASVLSLHSYYQ